MRSLIFISIIFSLTACNGKSLLKFKEAKGIILPVEEKPETDLTYLRLKDKIFKTSCTKCHNPESAAKKKRLDLTKKQLIIENYDDILYRMTEAFDLGFDYMPEEGGPVSEALISELKAWKASLEETPARL